MPDTPQSSGERHIEKIMEQLEPDSDRYQVLDTAKRFKSSWVELGDKLLQVSSRGKFREWGYQSFEEYCVQEIRIKKGTAEKLTLAYRYMEKQEPELLARRDELRPLPDYRSVNLLRQAKEEKSFSDEEYADLRKSIVDEERSHPTVLKRFKEVAAARSEEPADPLLPLKVSLAAARRLDTALRGMPDLPAAYRDELGSLIAHLEGELESLQGKVEPE
jgi:vacuolar-type H+-ATPase subunit I/STV1